MVSCFRLRIPDFQEHNFDGATEPGSGSATTLPSVAAGALARKDTTQLEVEWVWVLTTVQ